jgi:tripartite ATP-independent transporter DctM subunit
MRKTREILRLRWADKRSLREVGLACGVGSTTVHDVLARAKAAGLTWPLADDLDDAALEAKLYAPPEAGRERPLPDFAAIYREMKRRGVTLELLWQEYRAEHPNDGYGYSRFCDLYRGWAGRLLALAAVPAAFALGLVPERLAAAGWPFALLVLAALVLGTPVFVAMAALALFFFFRDGLPVTAVSAEVYRLISSPTLPAIPLLTACGYVLAESRASLRLLRFFRSLLGWLPGGLAVIVIAVCALFTTFTGGSGITVIAIGGLVLPMLLADGWPESFALGLVTAAGSLGLLFPPSLPVILYSVVAGTRDQNVPADSLYLAGLVPGALMIAMVAAYAVVKGRELRLPRQRFEAREVARATWEAKWELAIPLFVVGLFVSGKASMVETAAAALAFAIFVECVVTRDLHPWHTLPAALVKACVLAGSVLILLSAAMGITSYIVDAQIPDALVSWVRTHIESRWVFLLALNALLIVVGCLVDIFSAIVVLAPLLVPMASAFGVHPVHLGVIFLSNLELGYLTPPVGLNLYLAASRFDKPLTTVVRCVLPFLLIMALSVLLITYVPALSVGVLELLGR